MGVLLEKVNSLFNRMAQADVRTLTARLKRQHLSGADVGHLSRATISSILNEVSSLRTHFRQVLDDERTVVIVSRKEFRALLKTMNEVFQEWGGLRASVNEVVLNPAVANRLREEALAAEDSAKVAKSTGALGGWIAPLQKLWGSPTPDVQDSRPAPSAAPAVGALGRNATIKRGLQPKIAPKLAPAVSASTTTVNVEFTNSGIRRAISTTPNPLPVVSRTSIPSPLGQSQTRPQLAGIFAGSSGSGGPMKSNSGGGDWVVPPSGGAGAGSKTTERPGRMRFNQRPPIAESNRRLSRAVDAMVDQHRSSAVDDDDEEEDEFPNNLLRRTLRPRGLSDSSIASHLISQHPAPVNRLLTPAGLALSSPTVAVTGEISSNSGGWLDKDAMWQGIRSGMGRFRFATPLASGASSLTTQSQSKPEVDDGVITPSGGTPTATSSVLPSSTLPITPARSNPRRISTRAEGSVSPKSRMAMNGTGRGASPRTASLLPNLPGWIGPAAGSPALSEGERRSNSDQGIGRTIGRARGL